MWKSHNLTDRPSLLLGICYFRLALWRKGSEQHSQYISEGAFEGRASPARLSLNDLEAHNVQPQYDMGYFQHQNLGSECSTTDGKRPSLPYLPVTALQFNEKQPITDHAQAHSPLNQDQTLDKNSSEPFSQLASMYSKREWGKDKFANLVANTPAINIKEHHATMPVQSSLSAPIISTLSRRASITSSLNSHPWTCTIFSLPLSIVEQDYTPKVPPIPTRYHAEQLGLDEPSTIPTKEAPERPRTRPQLPPQAFWSYIIEPATEHPPDPDSTITCNSSHNGASQPTKLDKKDTTSGRYSFLSPQYQESMASSVYDEDVPEVTRYEPVHPCNEVCYENLRKGGALVIKETLDMGQIFGEDGAPGEQMGSEQFTRKRRRTLVKQRQPSDGGIGTLAKGGDRPWITVAL